MHGITLVPDQFHLEAILARQFRDLPDVPVMQAPPVFVLSQWMKNISSRIDLLSGKATAATPGRYELRQLWDFAIRESYREITAQESYSLSGQAMNFDRLLSQWGEEPGERKIAGPGDHFKRWQSSVVMRKKELGWYNSIDWLVHFSEQLSNSDIPSGVLPKAITLHGFVELSALEESVFGGLRTQGVEVYEPPLTPGVRTTAIRTGFPDTDSEISAMAQWAKQQVADGVNNIAIIYNGLDSAASRIQRTLENTFDPEGVLAHSRSSESVFHMASSSSLASHPLVSDALLLLSLAMGGRYQKHEFPDISRLLLSDNWNASDTEKFSRASLEVKLRKSGYFKCSLTYIADRISKQQIPEALQYLRDCINEVTSKKGNFKPADQFIIWLKQWGWPGKSESCPETVACYRLFLGLLEGISSHASLNDCYLQLQRSCAETNLPALGGPFSPVQVLTPEQAFGRNFDAAWISNLTMENWPQRPVSNPFLTASSARRIPRATEDGMLEYTKYLTTNLLSCATELRISWCDRLNDLPVSPSPLITHIPVLDGEMANEPELWIRTSPQAATINSYKDNKWLRTSMVSEATSVPLEDDSELRSVIPLLNMQSACPLAAYLVFRLEAIMPAQPVPFTDASYRGTLVHAALECLYRKYRNSTDRPGHGEIHAAVSAAFDAKYAEQYLLPAVLAAEKILVEGMLRDWLEHEQSMVPGEIVELEWKTQARIAGFSINVQIDRIDRIADDQFVLIDYKTGASNKISHWGKQRLLDVQLPLYAILLNQAGQMKPTGISFANIRLHAAGTEGLGTGACVTAYGLCGFGHRPSRLAKQLGSWNQALTTWQGQITFLLDEFTSGNVSHQIFHEPGLKYSGLESLLRFSESTRWQSELEVNEN